VNRSHTWKFNWPRRYALLLAAAAPVVALFLPGAVSAAAGTGYSVSLLATHEEETQVAVDSATDTVYAIADVSSQVQVVNGATGTLTTTVTLPLHASAIAVDAATDTVYVAESPDAVAVISGASNTVTATISTAATGSSIAVDSATDTIYMVGPNNPSVTVINGASNTVSSTISTGSGTEPYAVAVDEATDIIWLANMTGTVIAINGSTNSIASSTSLGAPGAPTAIAVDPVTDVVYCNAPGSVAVIDGATGTVTATIAATAGRFGLAVDAGTDTIYATDEPSALGSTATIDGATNSVTDTLDRGGIGVAVDQTTGTAYEAAALEGGLYVITPAAANAWSPILTVSSPYLAFRTGQAGTFTITSDALPAATITETGAMPSGLSLSSDGVLAGTPGPLAGGDYPITITASNGVAPAYSEAFDLTVLQYPVFTSASATTFQVGTQSSFALQVVGYPPPYSVTEGGPLPSGIQLVTDAGGWELSGTPAFGSGGVYPIVLFADKDSSEGQGLQNFTLTVVQAPVFTSRARATFKAGARNTFAFHTTAYPVAELSERGRLPTGVRFRPRSNGTAILIGKAARSDRRKVYVLTVTAQNGVGVPVHQTFRLRIS
jgi:large repetitive protein